MSVSLSDRSRGEPQGKTSELVATVWDLSGDNFRRLQELAQQGKSKKAVEVLYLGLGLLESMMSGAAAVSSEVSEQLRRLKDPVIPDISDAGQEKERVRALFNFSPRDMETADRLISHFKLASRSQLAVLALAAYERSHKALPQ